MVYTLLISFFLRVENLELPLLADHLLLLSHEFGLISGEKLILSLEILAKLSFFKYFLEMGFFLQIQIPLIETFSYQIIQLEMI